MYNYGTQKKFVYTDEGINLIIEMLDKLKKNAYLNTMELLGLGDSWNNLACIDWLENNNKITLISERYKDIRNSWVYKLNQRDDK